MPEVSVATDPPARELLLPCPLPPVLSEEPPDLKAFRGNPGDERTFMKLRRGYRESEDWRSLATLLVLHATHGEKPAKSAEMLVQAYELWLERVRDKPQAAHALARVVLSQPENARAYERLRKLYETLGWYKELAQLLTWRIEATGSQGAELAPLYLEIARVYEQQLSDLANAVSYYERALTLDPTISGAGEHLIALHVAAGAWRKAASLISKALDRLDVAHAAEQVADLHIRLARVEAEHLENVASAARHLQVALKAQPESVLGLKAFGNLYLGSGKATEDGMTKAADIFFKAAEIAQRTANHSDARKLLNRALQLRPNHDAASMLLEQTLAIAGDWLTLDALYHEWLSHLSGRGTVSLLLRRADLLENKLERREEARGAYEQASSHQSPDSDSWVALERIYAESGDYYALADLFERAADIAPDSLPPDKLLRAAQIYRDELGNDERAAVFYYKVLEREPFDPVAFEGYKEHWRRKHNWVHLRDLILYQIEQAGAYQGRDNPLTTPAFAEEFVELADLCERRLGDIDAALDAWHRMASAYPDDARPKEHIARIEKRTRMWDNMVRVQEAELERTSDPDKRIEIVKRLTQVYRDRQANPARAIQLYHEILESHPGDVQASRALAALYDRTGDYAEVVKMLRDQYQQSRSNTERISLLRRMAELWHHELDNPDEAIWACEQILSHVAGDKEALHRLQTIHDERENHDALLSVLERELKLAATPEDKIKLLRRMARIAEVNLHDHERTLDIWAQLLALQPNNLDFVDKMISAYEQADEFEQMAALLGKAAASAKTPLIRQQHYLLRLGALAERSLDDPDLARGAFERVIRIQPDCRPALEALARLYRDERTWSGLANVLATLQQLAETDDRIFQIAWERATILAEQLGEAPAAARVLEDVGNNVVPGNHQINERLLELYQTAGEYGKLVRHAELMLLAAESAGERRHLFEVIADTWLRNLDDKHAALAAYHRFIDEFSDDLDGLWTMANLQEETGDWQGTLATLQRRLELAADPFVQVTTLEHMAEVCERGLGEHEQALVHLRRALAIDPLNDGLKNKVEEFATRHAMWLELLAIADERFDQMGDLERPRTQVEICMDAARLAEHGLSEAPLAFNWARRGYFVALEYDLDVREIHDRLQQLAEDHDLWPSLLEVIEQEIDLKQSGVVNERALDVPTRLLAAAEIAEHQTKDPPRAVGYLQRAHQLKPEDNELSQRLEQTAKQHQLWPAVIALYESRLARAETDLGRLDACVAIAKVYEQQLNDYEKAFDWLRRGWSDLRQGGGSMMDEAHEAMIALAERHKLWHRLARHHTEVAHEAIDAGNVDVALDTLLEAARIHDESLDDPLSGIRLLSSGLEHDSAGQRLLPTIRALGEKLDEARQNGAPAIGSIAHLQAIQRVLAGSTEPRQRIELLEERARIREQRLGDVEGAMAEWMRVLRLDPASSLARNELERIADAHGLWHVYILLPAWEIERTLDREQQADLYTRISDIYETKLLRYEYALRARIEAWRMQPELPDRGGPLTNDHEVLWRLAKATGPYHTPTLPKDPLVHPELRAPEQQDGEMLRKVGLPAALLESSTTNTAVGRALKSVAPMTLELDVEEILDAVESADEHVEELADASEPVELGADDSDLVVLDELIGTRRKPPAPPTVQLPSLPELSEPLLRPRPRVATAWDELALAYADVPAPSKAEKSRVALVLARMWEDGAGQVERAFAHYEQALLLVPELSEALEGIVELATRHDATRRLLQAYEHLLSEAALPEQVVAYNIRIAKLHERLDEPHNAEKRYRAVLSVQTKHEEALEALCRIYETAEDHNGYVEVFARLLDVQVPKLEDDQRIARTRKLADLLDGKLARHPEAIERLEQLIQVFPTHVDVHEHLIDILIRCEYWQKAIEALRNSSDAAGDDQLRARNLERIADIYETKLHLQDRAIDSWNQHREVVSADRLALSKLQELYLSTGRYELLLPVIDELLELTPEKDREARIPLLVAKARALQEGINDERAATDTLEQLMAEAPANDEVALGLSRLYRRAGRFREGVDLLKGRIAKLSAKAHERRVTLTDALAKILADEAQEPDDALALVEAALKHTPNAPLLLLRRTELARALHDIPLLVDSLAGLADLDGWLEAAELARTRLRNPARALELYAKVLAQSRIAVNDPNATRRTVSAIEGLVRLRIEDRDVEGAMEFMDRQLAEVKGSTVRAHLLSHMGRIIYRNTGDVDAARARFDAALHEDPEYARAKLGLGEILFEAGQLAEAEQLIESAVEALTLVRDQEPLVEGLVLLARLLEMTDRVGEAYRRLTTAQRHDPDSNEIRAAIVRNRHGAKRWRDALTVVDQLEKRLAEGGQLSPKHARLVSNVMVLAADCEAQLKTDKVIARYRRALDIDPSNPRALEALIPVSQEQGAFVDAAKYADTLARQTNDPIERGLRLVEAGLLYDEAATATAATTQDTSPGVSELQPLRRAGIECLRMALALIDSHPSIELETQTLERAFQATAMMNAGLALRWLDRLLACTDLSLERRIDVLLEGVRVATESDDRELLVAAEAHAQSARALAPTASAPVLALARVLELADRTVEVETMVTGFFGNLDANSGRTDDKADRVALLVRLSEMQEGRPEKAVSSLEHAATLDPRALSIDVRKRLASLHGRLGRLTEPAFDNHEALVELDPLYVPSLVAQARRFERSGELDRAYAYYGVLLLADPSHSEALEFLATNGIVGGTTGELEPADVVAPESPTAGVSQALLLLWEGNLGLLGEHLPRLEVPQETRISPVGDTLLSQIWAEMLKRLGQSKVALADATLVDPSFFAAASPDAEYFQIRCQQPPLILAGRKAKDCRDESELRFALARALYFTRPESIFAMGVPRQTFAEILSATLHAFHPRHARRKHYTREDDSIGQLSQELVRKLPIRVSRQLAAVFKEHDHESFDSRLWRVWVRQAGNRIGLLLCGDIEAAVRVVTGEESIDPSTLRKLVDQSDELRDLIAFSTTRTFAEARRKHGAKVVTG